jgi:hypothetical protein
MTHRLHTRCAVGRWGAASLVTPKAPSSTMKTFSCPHLRQLFHQTTTLLGRMMRCPVLLPEGLQVQGGCFKITKQKQKQNIQKNEKK